MPFSDEFISKWEHIIQGVDMTAFPLECIKKVVIHLDGKRRRTINIHKLKKQGLDLEQIEVIMSSMLHEHGDSVRDLTFTVDVEAVAEIVQPETDKILKGIR